MTISQIGLINESNLHSALKHEYSGPNAVHESTVDGYVVDVFQNSRIIEIQTGSFTKIKPKISELLPRYSVKLVYPIACEKTIVVYDSKMENVLYKRKSPKKCGLIDVADEIIHIPELIIHPNFSLDVLFTKEEEVRTADGRGSWRRRGISILDRKLLGIINRVSFEHAGDYLMLLPESAPMIFTNRHLSQIMKKPVKKIRKLTYSLKKIGLLEVVGKQGNAQLFKIS
jgi:hypothetical protein